MDRREPAYVYYRPGDIAKAYEALSRADIYLSRAQRTGNYGLWKYATDLMTAGVAVAGVKKKGFVRIYPPKTIKLLTESKAERSLRDSILKKIMKEMHMAKPEALETLNVLRAIFEYNPDMAAHFVVYLDLDLKEVEFITGGDAERARTIWGGKSMNIEKKLKERSRLEEHVRAAVEERREEKAVEEESEESEEEEVSEEELQRAEEEERSISQRRRASRPRSSTSWGSRSSSRGFSILSFSSGEVKASPNPHVRADLEDVRLEVAHPLDLNPPAVPSQFPALAQDPFPEGFKFRLVDEVVVVEPALGPGEG